MSAVPGPGDPSPIGAPSGGPAAVRVEGVLALFLITVRWVALAITAANLRAASSRLRRPRLAWGMLAAACGHGLWATWRTGRDGRIGDPVVAASEVPVGVALLMTEQLAYAESVDGGGGGPRLGADHWGFAGALAAAELPDDRSVAGWLVVLLLARLASRAQERRRRNDLVTGALYDSLILVEAILARRLVDGARARAVALDEAHRNRAEGAGRLSAERERRRHLRVVHDDALQVLEAVGAGWSDAAVPGELGRSAARLAAVLDDADAPTASLEVAVNHLVEEFAARGLLVEVVFEEGPCPAGVVDTLVPAIREALTNVVKHAGVDRVQVHVVVGPGLVAVTVHDEGTGFDPSSVPAGAGLAGSLIGRITDAGGSVDVRSRPGGGTTVALRVPR